VAGAADFNGDAKADLLLWNATTRHTAIWYLNGVTVASRASGPTLPSGYTLKLVDDFNGDGKPDIVLWNPATHQSAIWHLNNNLVSSRVVGPTIPTGWSLRAPK
jgi:hypothetical protein